jgi:predicted ABC-type exoprotein transport system permease subunit
LKKTAGAAAEVAAMIGEVAVLPVAAPLLNTVRQAGAERLMLLLYLLLLMLWGVMAGKQQQNGFVAVLKMGL